MGGMSSPTRIYLVGAHATGKTTLARWIRDRYALPMISEVARGVLAEMEAQLDSLRTNLDLVNEYQAQVFERQLEMEKRALLDATPGRMAFVSDRAFCNLAYAAHHSTILSQVMEDPRLAEYMNSVKEGVVFYLRPHRDLLVEDGVRAGVDWEEVVRIDGMVKLMLELFAIPYVPVDCLPMQERTRLVESVLDLAGLRPAREPKRFFSSPGLAIPSAPPRRGDTAPAEHGTNGHAKKRRGAEAGI